jgi:hypothetical protein
MEAACLLANKRCESLLRGIRSQFLHAPHQVLCFYPTTENLTGGWKDFYRFCSLYQALPDGLKELFGPYQLVIKPLG